MKDRKFLDTKGVMQMGNSENKIEKEYLTIAELAKYVSISQRTLRDHLKDPINPIPHFRIGTAGRIIRIKKSEFDEWMKSQKATQGNEIDAILADVLK